MTYLPDSQTLPDLAELFQKYERHTDKECIHHYGRIYEQWLATLDTVDRVLELGCNVAGGGCLLTFAERFAGAEIVGVDITTREIITEVREQNNIHLFECDVYRHESVKAFQRNIPGGFDLIVDDCLHEPEDQRKAFELWHPLLAENGLYVIEDVCDLDRISLLFSAQNREWLFLLGDTRSEDEYRFDSILLGLKRVKTKNNETRTENTIKGIS